MDGTVSIYDVRITDVGECLGEVPLSDLSDRIVFAFGGGGAMEYDFGDASYCRAESESRTSSRTYDAVRREVGGLLKGFDSLFGDGSEDTVRMEREEPLNSTDLVATGAEFKCVQLSGILSILRISIFMSEPAMAMILEKRIRATLESSPTGGLKKS